MEEEIEKSQNEEEPNIDMEELKANVEKNGFTRVFMNDFLNTIDLINGLKDLPIDQLEDKESEYLVNSLLYELSVLGMQVSECFDLGIQATSGIAVYVLPKYMETLALLFAFGEQRLSKETIDAYQYVYAFNKYESNNQLTDLKEDHDNFLKILNITDEDAKNTEDKTTLILGLNKSWSEFVKTELADLSVIYELFKNADLSLCFGSAYTNVLNPSMLIPLLWYGNYMCHEFHDFKNYKDYREYYENLNVDNNENMFIFENLGRQFNEISKTIYSSQNDGEKMILNECVNYLYPFSLSYVHASVFNIPSIEMFPIYKDNIKHKINFLKKYSSNENINEMIEGQFSFEMRRIFPDNEEEYKDELNAMTKGSEPIDYYQNYLKEENIKSDNYIKYLKSSLFDIHMNSKELDINQLQESIDTISDYVTSYSTYTDEQKETIKESLEKLYMNLDTYLISKKSK